MGLLSKMTEKATQEWAKNLTLEQIEEYERQGMDMSEYRIIYQEQQAEKQRCMDSIDLSKLDKYKNARSADFIDEVAKFNKISDKNKSNLEQAPLVYGKVVQAHSDLFESNPKNKDGGGIVFLFALDDTHRYDEEWLAKTAQRIVDMKESIDANEPKGFLYTICRLFNLQDNFLVSSSFEKQKLNLIPEDCKPFMKTLRDDQSSFGFKLGESLSGGADAWCATYSLWEQSKLPMAQIPPNRIIPLLLLTQQPKGFGGINDAALIPPAYYTS